ncbi:MAG: DeoR/GlpR transcriptional regulator, partial [Spirochaetales bacterium]
MVDRHEKIVALLARKGYRSVAELSAELSVSEMTIRRDLEKLEEKGLIKRTYGGAYTGQEIIEVDYRVRETKCQAEKEAIG